MLHDVFLRDSKLVAFVATTDAAKARTFYEDVLGLRLVADESPFALVFDANGTMLRVTSVHAHCPAQFTVLGCDVESIEGTVQQLVAKGVEFIRYPGLNDSDPNGIWAAPNGAQIAWMHDPDGNVLSVTQF
jgi:catechol 2,3-dioxygenase-like lactoylglutathione lyase family enzyme